MALWLAAVAWAISIAADCGTDCGDNGGRGAFIGLVAVTPLGAGGLALVVLGAERRGALLRLATRAALAGAALLAILALWVAVHSVLELMNGGRATAYDRSQMTREGTGGLVVSVILVGLAATGLLPWLAARRTPLRSPLWGPPCR